MKEPRTEMRQPYSQEMLYMPTDHLTQLSPDRTDTLGDD